MTADQNRCPWCGMPAHAGAYCPMVRAIEYYAPPNEGIKRVEFVQFEAPAPTIDVSDEAYRVRLLRHVGEASVNSDPIRRALGSELDKIGASYAFPRSPA